MGPYPDLTKVIPKPELRTCDTPSTGGAKTGKSGLTKRPHPRKGRSMSGGRR